MANMMLRDLVNLQDNGSLIQDLSENQLNIQGGYSGYKCHVLRVGGLPSISCPIYHPLPRKPILF
jgi:hypothetical protein